MQLNVGEERHAGNGGGSVAGGSVAGGSVAGGGTGGGGAGGSGVDGGNVPTSPSSAATSRFDALEGLLKETMQAVQTVREEHRQQERQRVARMLEQDRNQQLCVVCQDDAKSVLLLPCRHLCVCRGCSRRPELDKCPMCRAVIEQKMDVFS